jgi:hypothetical protein
LRQCRSGSLRLLSPGEPKIFLDAIIAKRLWTITPQKICNILLDAHFSLQKIISL